jgi:hypothetical protein
MQGTEALLTLMLTLHAPGRSPHAKIPLASCDDECQRAPRCDEPVLHCRPPTWSARHQRYFRFEDWEEGVRRYALIADVAATTAARMVWVDDDRCSAPNHGDDADPVCRALHRARPWSGSELSLQLLLATVMSHESSLRRDVHDGTTRGDCDYAQVGGKPEVIAGSCRSHCLGQVMVRPGQRTRRGYSADDLVGLDREATVRCMETVIDRLSGAHDACVAQHSGRRGAYAGCTMGVYGGVNHWSRDSRIHARLKTYDTLRARHSGLADQSLATDVQKALATLGPQSVE